MACGICASSMAGKFANGIAAIERKFFQNGSQNQTQPSASVSGPAPTQTVYGQDSNVFGNPTTMLTRNGTNPL